MRSTTLAHDAGIQTTVFFDLSWFEAMRSRGRTPDDLPIDSQERQAYKEYLDKLQVTALGSTKD